MPDWFYEIRTAWIGGERSIIPLSEKILETFDALSCIGPSYSGWRLLNVKTDAVMTLASARPNVTQLLSDNIWHDDWDRPDARGGYTILATTAETDDMTPRSLLLSGMIGSVLSSSYITLAFGGIWRSADPTVVSYPEFKAALMAIVSIWRPPWANAGLHTAHGMPPYFPDVPDPRRNPYGVPWIGYLCAERTAGLKPPPQLVCERTPDGGVLISSATERLDPDNTTEKARARLLSDIMLERGSPPGI